MSASERGRQIPIVCPGHTRPLAELQFVDLPSESRTFLLSACHDRMPMMRDGSSGDWIGTWNGHKGAVWSCQMDPSGSLAATASGDFSAKIWDAITGNMLQELPHKHIVKTCVFSPTSSKLATGGKEALLRVFQLDECLQEGKTEASLEIPQAAAISKVAWVTDSVLLCALEDGNIAVWDTNAPSAAIHTFSTQQAELIRDMELVTLTNTTGQQVLTVAAGSMVYFFDLSTKQLLHQWKMPIHFRDEGGASLHPSGTKFVAGGSDLWVRVFDFATGEEQECHKGHHGPIRCLRYSPNGTSYATGSEDGTIRLWKTDPESSQ